MLTSYKQALSKSGWNPIRPQDQILNTLQLFGNCPKKNFPDRHFLWIIFYVDSISFQKMQRQLQELKEEVSKKDDEKIKREREIQENEELHEEK